MPTFTQQYIASVNPPVFTGSDMLISWSSTAPAGYAAQVYIDGAMAWHRNAQRCHVPWPKHPCWIDVGHVPAAYARTAFPADLPAHPTTRASLSWQGGTFQGNLQGFRIYGESSPGGGINYAAKIGDVPAYVAGVVTDGYGYGGFGQGGYGQAAGSYSWRSDPLASGTWHFAVVPYGPDGVEGTGATTAVAVAAPPLPPAVFAGTMQRLAYNLSGYGAGGYGDGGYGSPTVTLTWNPTPTTS